MPGLAEAIEEAMRLSGVDLSLVGRAWARATPLVVLVPAFGLKALPTPVRMTLGLAFAMTIYPGLLVATSPADAGPMPMPMPAALLVELARGVPIALATAVPLWAATMAGGLADGLRGSNEPASFSVVEGRATSIAILFSLGAAVLFFATGGPARAVLALSLPQATPWLAAVTALVHGIGLAVSIAAPILTASIVLEVGGALIARAASPAHVDALLSPLKALALLTFIALALDRMLALAR